jgi:hypothetical protein
MTDKQGIRERYQREMDIDESACRICSLIAEEQGQPDPEHSCLDHMHYHARTLEKSADECYKASLELIFAHIADIHMVILKILSARYGHSVSDMLKTIMDHDEYKNIYLHPVLKSLVYFDPIDEGKNLWIKRTEEAKSVLSSKRTPSELEPERTPSELEPDAEKTVNIEPAKPKKSKPATVSRKKNTVVVEPMPAGPVSTPTESEPVPIPDQEPKKSKPAIVRKKVVVAVEPEPAPVEPVPAPAEPEPAQEPEPKKSKPAIIRRKVKE